MHQVKQFILEGDLEFIDNIARISPIGTKPIEMYKIVFKDRDSTPKFINAKQYAALYEYCYKFSTINIDVVNL